MYGEVLLGRFLILGSINVMEFIEFRVYRNVLLL